MGVKNWVLSKCREVDREGKPPLIQHASFCWYLGNAGMDTFSEFGSLMQLGLDGGTVC